ncbi:MAG: glycoside hydrolase family 28 protein [Phocaeicola sp.]
MISIKKLFLLPAVSLLALLTGCNGCPSATQQEIIDPSIYANLPFKMDKVAQPTFPNYSVSIVEFGAVADGQTLNTEAINNAIKHVNEKGGGKVIIPSGFWMTGPIELLSNVNLYTEKNSLIQFSADHNLYPIIETSFEGLNTKRCMAPLTANNAENVAITGHGTFDGNGDSWRFVKKGKMTGNQWKKLVESGGILDESGQNWFPNQGALDGMKACKNFNVPEGIETEEEWNHIRSWLRPVLLSFVKCNKVLLEGVIFKNSPSWCLHPLSCNDITLNKVMVINPWYSQNGDALDLESCNRALVVDCLFDAGDDGICIKSGKDKDGRERGEPCQNVIVLNSKVTHGHGGFVVGSEMSGGVKNVYVDNCTFLGTDVGLRFKSTRGRGGVVENIYINNINMINIPNEALIFNLYYGGKGRGEDPNEDDEKTEAAIPAVTEETPCFKDIYIKNVTVNGASRAVLFNGIPEMRIKNINMEDMHMVNVKDGVVLSESDDVTMKNVKVEVIGNKNNLTMKNVSNVNIDGKTYESVDAKGLKLNF